MHTSVRGHGDAVARTPEMGIGDRDWEQADMLRATWHGLDGRWVGVRQPRTAAAATTKQNADTAASLRPVPSARCAIAAARRDGDAILVVTNSRRDGFCSTAARLTTPPADVGCSVAIRLVLHSMFGFSPSHPSELEFSAVKKAPERDGDASRAAHLSWCRWSRRPLPRRLSRRAELGKDP